VSEARLKRGADAVVMYSVEKAPAAGCRYEHRYAAACHLTIGSAVGLWSRRTYDMPQGLDGDMFPHRMSLIPVYTA
jgi:hypothetical protein